MCWLYIPFGTKCSGLYIKLISITTKIWPNSREDDTFQSIRSWVEPIEWANDSESSIPNFRKKLRVSNHILKYIKNISWELCAWHKSTHFGILYWPLRPIHHYNDWRHHILDPDECRTHAYCIESPYMCAL